MARDREELSAQAERIRQLRHAKRVSEQEIADAIEVDKRTYQVWVGAEAGEISRKNLRKLADYFGTTPDYIEYGNSRRDTGEAADVFVSSRAEELFVILARIEQDLAELKRALEEVGKRL